MRVKSAETSAEKRAEQKLRRIKDDLRLGVCQDPIFQPIKDDLRLGVCQDPIFQPTKSYFIYSEKYGVENPLRGRKGSSFKTLRQVLNVALACNCLPKTFFDEEVKP